MSSFSRNATHAGSWYDGNPTRLAKQIQRISLNL